MAAKRLLGGRYRLIERLGEGGMSVVWRAYDEALGRPVAIKLLTAGSLTHASSRDRIRTEAQAAAKLSHPHITSVHDYGESANESGGSTPYVVMELLSGSTLADRLRAGPLPVRTALQVCAQVASALAAAHGSGLVHRDVKPANVMLTPAGAKVLDFGLAAVAGEPDESTSDGQVWGTPAYLAPERLTVGEVVPASDVYALGLLLYATLTGRRPWRAETVSQLLDAHRYEQPAPLPPIAGLPEDVAALCYRCLAKDARNRPAAHEAARVLAEAVGWRVSSAVAPWSGALPDQLAAVYSRHLASGMAGQSLVRAATPETLPPAVSVGADVLSTGPTVAFGAGRGGSGDPARSSVGWLRAAALAGSVAAVIASLTAGQWVVAEEPGRYGTPGPAAAGLGAAGWNPAPAPSLDRLGNGGPGPGDPAEQPVDPSPGGAAGTGGEAPGDARPDLAPGTGSGSSAGGGGSEADPTRPGGAGPGLPSAAPPSAAPPSAEPPSGEPPDSESGSGTPPASPTPDPVEGLWLTPAGTVVAQCVGSIASLVSWELLPGVSVGAVDPGPGPVVSIVLTDLLVIEVSVVVHCEAGAPVAAVVIS